MLRRKQTPKRRRIDINLDDDDEIPVCATFIDPMATTKLNTQNTSEGRLLGAAYPDGSAASTKRAITTASSSGLSPPGQAHHNERTNSTSQNHKLVARTTTRDDNQLPKPEPHKTTPQPEILTSPTRKPVASSPQHTHQMPVSNLRSQNQPGQKSEQQQQQQSSNQHRKSNNQIETSNDDSSPHTSTPKSKHNTPANSDKTQMASLKPLAKSMNNQVYLENYTHFNWAVYLELCPAAVAPKEAFMQTKDPLENKFEINMKLEAKDPRGKDVWSVATVIATEGLRIKLRLDGGDKLNDFYELIDSENIRPCQSRPDQLLYAPVGYRGDISNYANFVHKIFTNPDTIFATEDIFPPHPPRPKTNLFKPGMKLEAIDGKNPHMICPSTVAEVLDNNRIKIMFDGWPLGYALDYPYYSRLLFPVNWCRDTGHQIVPPLRWDKFLEDAQPLVDMNKILGLAWNQSNASGNKTATAAATTTTRTSRSSSQQQVGTRKNHSYHSNTSTSNSIKSSKKHQTKTGGHNNKYKQKLAQKMKKLKQTTKSKISVPKFVTSTTTPTTTGSKATKAEKQHKQTNSNHGNINNNNNYQPELLTPHQILEQNRLSRLERKKNDLATRPHQMELARQAKFMTEPMLPFDGSLLPETSALIRAISSDDLSDLTVMKNKSKQQEESEKPPHDHCATIGHGDDDQVQILHHFVGKKPASCVDHSEPTILSKVNLIPAPGRSCPQFEPN